jgi:hypothetical protein
MQNNKEKLLPQAEKIFKHLRLSGGKFGDSNITTERNIYISMSRSLVDIGDYCKKYTININELDSIKLMVFALPYMKENDPSMNSERYIYSIFLLFSKAYKTTIEFEKQINNSISVCEKLFQAGEILAVYGYIKGFQESLIHTKPQ